ncbi:MAG: class I SAM-dependent methyltransferase, partial [Acidimicrobiales bacterium]
HHVTAIDIGQNFVDLINARAARVNASIEALMGDFSMVHELDGLYDAVLFFESFHHCADHLNLLAGLDRVVVPGGRVVFAGEPISKSMPVPWGLRLDGESLWAIRKNGWLELGFRRSYFLGALERHGWEATSVRSPEPSLGEILVARRRAGVA